MTCLPKITAGVEGGPVTADTFTSISETSTIPFGEASNSAKSIAHQAELLAIKNESKKFERK